MIKDEGGQGMVATNKPNNSALPIAEPAFSTPASMREFFIAWLSASNAKKYHPQSAVACLDRISEYVISKKISCSIWEISKPGVFKPVYKKVLEAKLLRIMERNTHKTFTIVGQLYLKFLKEKPWEKPPQNLTRTEIITTSVEPDATNALTIKEAISLILKDTHQPISAVDIYNRIVSKGLYAFGAQNPINVVRNILESACDNSTYSEQYRVAVPIFHYEKNRDGKRVYTLLSAAQTANTETASATTDNLLKPVNRTITIWDERIEQEFQRWLENENYAQKTADNYRRATAQIFRNYASLAEKATSQFEDELEVVRGYVVLLNDDNSFVEANATRHNQFTAALAALERFYSVGVEFVGYEKDEQITNSPETINIPTSSLGNIVDLEEGKEGLREILETHFQTLYGYSNISIVWNAAQDNISLFLNDNAINTADELWRFMYRVFLGEYVMSNPHIWKVQPNYPQSYVGVIINLARQFGGTVTREQIDEYFARIKQGSQINANIIRSGYLAFYAPKHFILTEAINLSSERIAAITKALDRLFERERVFYIVLRDISDDWFSSLPVLKGNLNWTALLLQEVLRLRSAVSYRTVFSGLNGQAYDTLGVAIVPSKSEINSFADVAHRHCYENELLGRRMLTEDLRIILRDAGMLEGNELIYNLHKALRDYRFAFTDENRMVKILER
jgi:hypothetical protein